jgi:hypothetical protein
LGESPIAGNALIHQLLRLGKRITRDHRGQEGIAGGADRGRPAEDHLAGSITVGDPKRIAAVAQPWTVKQGRGGAVESGTNTGLERNIHREDNVINLVGQLLDRQHIQQGRHQIGLKIIAGPKGIAARPIDK